MYPTLPFGPLALPTGPILAIFAVILTLDVAGRMGWRQRVHPDDLWNVGLIILAASLIVARLWNVFQFWYIYSNEPLLIFSLRPSGFAFWPGVVAGLVTGYSYLLWRALDPLKIAAALAVGLVAGSSILGISGHATGAVLGTVTDVPWALPYFGEMRHAVGLYRTGAALLLVIILWHGGDVQRPGRMVLQAGLGYSLIRLLTDAFVDNQELVAGIRVSQLVALGAALFCTLLLARTAHSQPTEVAAQPGDAPAPLVQEQHEHTLTQ